MKPLLRFWYIPTIAILIFIIIKFRESNIEMDAVIKGKNKKEASQKKEIQTEATILNRKISKEGLERVTIAEAENVLPRGFLNDDEVRPGLLDSTTSALNIIKKQLESITVINSTLEAENLVLKKNIDSLKRVYYTYNDKYLAVKFKMPDAVDTVPTFDYKYNAKLNYVQYWKREFPILGAKRSFIDIWSDDKRNTINGVDRLKIEQREPQFGLRVQMRSIYGLSSQKLFVGPGLSFDLKRYNVLGYSYYNVNDNRWFHAVGVNYDLIRF